ncbi:hypothetical protein G3I77_02260 [Streptomyces sp. D2-8]|uniref:hypothetical protein n=1 Tax=Streptomyces sp. D2-8 TaxID=2707767 RepID=UPI0020BF1275|nr:hypothetical protein [Streptomyces sp. D2-8]MCK8431887.1 hypothetical protein [Streptomyces sp. D2-8]
MTSPSARQWWVIYREPNPAQIDVVAVETPPEDDAAHDKRCAELEASGQAAYVVTAPDEDVAGDIALRVWSEELVNSPTRLAAADAYLASLNQPTD